MSDENTTAVGSPNQPPPIAIASVRQRFQARAGAVPAHNNMLGSPEWLRARDTALLAMQEDLLEPFQKKAFLNPEQAQAVTYMMQGAARVFDIISKLGWMAPETQPIVNDDALPTAKREAPPAYKPQRG